MKWTVRHAVVSTLAYADLFDFPLTKQELYRWLITDTVLKPDYDYGISDGTYVSLTSLKEKVQKRTLREHISIKKQKIATEIASMLGNIPTVLLIGVSGGLAMHNVEKEDDIDFFVVVQPGMLWITRLSMVCLLELLGKRRKVGDTHVEDKICINMIVDAQHLQLPKEEQDLYSAHEVLQMVPLIQKGDIYVRFLEENVWVKRYLYNAWCEKSEQKTEMRNQESFLYPIFCILFSIFEKLAKHFQLWYMKKHRTTERISDVVVRFHPKDTREFIRKNYLSILREYKIPLDRRFFKSLK